MPKKFIQRLIPSSDQLKTHKHLRLFGQWLHSPSIWHLNRHSASGAIAVGLFVAFLPIPTQMLVAAALAIALRINLPLAVASVWVSNPITWPLFIYGSHYLGRFLLGKPPVPMRLEMSMDGLQYLLASHGSALLLGSTVAGLVFSALGYWAMNLIWRYSVRRRYLRRRLRK